jgi:membrane dipeptidase
MSKTALYFTAFKKLCVLISAASWIIAAGCSDEARDKIAAVIHDKVLTVDTHVDTPLLLVSENYDLGMRHEPKKIIYKLDLPRMEEGGLDAVFLAIFVFQGPRTPEGNEKAKQNALKTFTAIKDSLDQNADAAELALTPDDAYRLQRDKRRAIFIGMENGYPVGTDLSLIQTYYELGARYITLCHWANNDICDAATDPAGPEHNGLSEFGKQVVAEMNRLGMMVDISHVSDKTVLDVLEMSTAPIIASHSSARAVYEHPRNLPDELLKKIADKGGVVQATIEYVKAHASYERPELPTVAEFVDHIDHIVQVAGIDHVGIGTDFDGGGELADCYDVSEMGNITRELVKRGYTARQIEKIWGGNLMHVFKEVQERSELH